MNRNYLDRATLGLVTLFLGASLASAQVAATIGPNLNRFSVFGSGGVVGAAAPGTTVNGDVGGFATCTVTNFGPSTVVFPFVVHNTGCNAITSAADGEATTAFGSLTQAGAVAINPSLNLVDLNGALFPPVGVLVPGNYSTGAAILPSNTTLTFDGNGIYVIQVASTLDVVTGPLTNMVLINGANACDIYWQVGSSANLEVQPGRQFVGQVFASSAVTVTAGNVVGRAIALNAAATLSNGGNTVGGCATPAAPVCPAITVAPSTVPNGALGVAYSQSLSASGGTAPYTFAVSAGTLPAGLTLSSAGVLSGTPTTSGTSNFTIRATDANFCLGTLAYALTVAPAVPTLPEAFFILLALMLAGIGYLRLRRQPRTE